MALNTYHLLWFAFLTFWSTQQYICIHTVVICTRIHLQGRGSLLMWSRVHITFGKHQGSDTFLNLLNEPDPRVK